MSLRRIAAVLLLVLVGAGCGSESGDPITPAAPPSTGTPQPSRTAAPIVEAAQKVQAARAQGQDPAQLSSGVVHVRADGAIEVLLHTTATVTTGQLAEVRNLGAEVVTTTPTPATPGQPPASLVQLWVPAAQIAALDTLPWVATVTAPSYGAGGG